MVNVVRPNREFLLDIKKGRYEYNDLLVMAQEKQLEMELAFENSDLPQSPDLEIINNLTYQLRNKFYNEVLVG